MELIKFFRKGLLFAVIVSAIYLGAFFILGNVSLSGQPLINWFNPNLSTKGTIHRAALEYEKDKPFDIAVFGSSHAYRGYDPRIFQEKMGKKLFNFGSSAQSIPNSYIYINNETQKAKYDLVILDLLVTIFENRDLESSIILTRNVSDDKIAMDILKEEKDIRLLNINLARHLIMNDDFYYKNPDYISHGFVSKTDSMKTPDKMRDYKAFDPSPRAVERFKDILEYCRQNDVPLVLVNQPRPKETNVQKNNEFIEFVQEANEVYDFPFYDYSMEHNLPTGSNFYDLGHMNQSGVENFNARLIVDLKALLLERKEE